MPERPLQGPTARGGRPVPPAESDTAVRRGFSQQLKERLNAADVAEAKVRPVKAAVPAKSPKAPAGPQPAPAAPVSRRARLRLTRIDPWSVMKMSFLLSIALGIVTIVAVFVVWSVLNAAGVWNSINSTVQDTVGGDSGSSFDITHYLGMSKVMGFTMIVAVIDVILMTAIGTLGAFLYNMAAAVFGGVDVTFVEDK